MPRDRGSRVTAILEPVRQQDGTPPDYISTSTLASAIAAIFPINLATQVTGRLPFANIATIATASVLGRNTAGVGDIQVLATLPNAVQDAITRLGTVTNGVWNGTLIGVGFGGTGTATAFTPGSIVFAGAAGTYTQDNANIFYDAVNHRVGIGTAVPNATLQLVGVFRLGDGTGNRFLLFDGGVGSVRSMQWQSGSVTRWTWQVSGAEGGADAGSNFSMLAANDAGGGIDTPFGITRASGGAIKFGGTTLRPTWFSGSVSIGTGATATALCHLAAGTATASTAPLKFTSGVSLTTAEAGAVEFTTDDFFATITTGAARKAFVLDDGARLTSGKIPIATTNGRLIDGPTPLAGTKTYFVSDTNGGALNRKLTFTNGILTAET